MSSGDWDVDPAGLTLPQFAGPNDPAIVLGAEDLPANLVTYYANLGQTLVSAEIFRRSSTNYTYLALVDDGVFGYMAAGASSGGTVSQSWTVSRSGNSVGQFDIGGPFGGTLRIFMAAGGDFQIAQSGAGLVSQSRGYIAHKTGNSTGPFIGAESVILQLGSTTFRPGRVFELGYEVDCEGDTANNFASFNIRRHDFAGTILRFGSGHPMSSVAGFGTTCVGSALVGNFTGSDIVDNMVLTLQSPLAGAVRQAASGNRLARFWALDIGDTTAWPDATPIT